MNTTEWITSASKLWGVKEDVLKQEFETTYTMFKTTQPNTDEQILQFRTRQRLATVHSHQRSAGGKVVAIDGYVLNVTNPFNSWEKKMQAQRAVVERYKASGDIQRAVDEGLIKIDDNGKDVLVFPPKTKEGADSGRAGQTYDENEETHQDILMLTLLNEKLSGIVIERRGKATRESIPTGVIIQLSANETKTKGKFISRATFIATTNKDLIEKMEKADVGKIAETSFGDKVIDLKTAVGFKDAVPQNLRNFAIVKECLLNYIDMTPTKGGYVNIELTDGSSDFNVELFQKGLLRFDEAQKINYGIGTKVAAAGRLWFGKPDEVTGEKPLIFNVDMLFPYKDFIVDGKPSPGVTMSDLSAEPVAAVKGIKISGDNAF